MSTRSSPTDKSKPTGGQSTETQTEKATEKSTEELTSKSPKSTKC